MQAAAARHFTLATRVAETSERLGWPVVALIAAQIVFSAVIIARPDIDTHLSAEFYRAGVGFPLAQDAHLLLLRWLGRAVPASIAIVLTALVVWRLLRKQTFVTISDRALAFVACSFALGPGLIVNVILKSHWGRARPLATDLFGGSAQFTPAWWPWGECYSNCSFVSGEASTAAVLMALAAITPRRYRSASMGAVTAWMIAISLNRMAFGAHYFSDVVLSCLLTLTVVYALKALIIGNPSAA